LPLQQAVIEVHGIDALQAILDKLKAKRSAESIQVTLGNFADVDVDEHFDLIFAVLNTFFALLTQDEQIRCFKNIAGGLTPNGVFLIEAFLPDMARFVDNQVVKVFASDDNSVRLEATQVDMIAQQINSKLIHLSEDGIRMYPVKIRYD
jgi:trans-aconitate methyltransferase